MSLIDQKHLDFFFFSVFLREVPRLVLPLSPPLLGLPCTFDFISLERVVKALSTLTVSYAEISKKLIPRESARVLPKFRKIVTFFKLDLSISLEI